jgi:GDP-D-mannose dehydratase
MPVNRYEATQQARISELETEVKLRDANFYTLGEMGKLRDYVDGKFARVEKEICEQHVLNTATTSTINCLASQVAQLMSLTKTVIPIASICPQPAVATPTT